MPCFHGVLAGAYPSNTVLVQLSDQTIFGWDTTGVATITLGNNGDVRDQTSAVQETWLITGVASGFDVRATITSGTLTSGTTGSWLNLATSRSWTRNDTTIDGVATECTMTVEIRHATTLAVLDTATITLSASKEGA